jgi:hypothetical protein
MYDKLMNGKQYFPNNWQEYKDAPDDLFQPHTFDEVMSWKVAGWELPGSVSCIMRITDNKTGKVKEIVYQRDHAAEEKMRRLMRTPDIEVTVCNHDSIHHIIMKSTDELEDDDD